MAWLTDMMRQGMDYFVALSGNHGVAIILLTIAVRLLLLPLTITQTRATARMQVMQPEIREIERRYKNNPEQKQRELMELYRRHGTNPLAGCLPTLLQLPFFFAFFNVLNKYPYPGNPSFLWIPHLGQHDPLYVLPVLAGVATYFQTRVTMPAGNDPSQRTMLWMFPVLITWMSMRFAAGLALYWVVSSLWGIVEKYAFVRQRPAAAPAQGGSGR